MPFVIGTDEAGYGPKLGPLVVSASVWRVAEPLEPARMYAALRGVIGKKPQGADGRRLAIADSKLLYSSGQGIAELERGVLAALGLLDRLPADWLDAWHTLSAGSLAYLSSMPWHADYELPLPLAADPADLARLVPRVAHGCQRAAVELVGLRSRALFAHEFNDWNDQLGNKSDTLSKTTLELVAEVLAGLPAAGLPDDGLPDDGLPADGEADGRDQSVRVVCDKHGGRDYYLRLLQNQFPDNWIEVRRESPAESVYRWNQGGRQVELGFYVRGERFLPVALASMTSKYLRELAMRPFNEFWCGRVANLAPTAGYARDAWRFKSQIEATRAALGIDDRMVWRER